MTWLKFEVSDEQAETFLPMTAYLQAVINRSDFVKEVDDLTRGYGGSIEGNLGCSFPQQIDEYDLAIGDAFDGVEFRWFEKQISVDVPTFRKYLRMACEAYLQHHPEDRQQLEEYLARPQPPLEEGTTEEWRRRRDAGEYRKPLSDAELSEAQLEMMD